MVNWRKVKTFLEWARLAKFVFDLAVAGFSLNLVKKLLSYVPHLSADWARIISYVVGAIVLYALLWWQERRKAPTQEPAEQKSASNTLLNSSTFDATAFFQQSYVSTMDAEIKNNTRTAAELNNPGDRETFYLKLIAIGLPAFTYDVIWAYIFRSQVLALLELNRRILTVDQLKAFYDKAAAESPERYANYTFDQWVEFLKSNLLLILHPSGMVEVTVRAKDFLKYLTHNGRYADDRKF